MKSYAQFGEDLILAKYFGESFKGNFIEIGANQPKTINQTYLLETLGWKGILIEPNPKLCEALRAERKAIVSESAVSSPDFCQSFPKGYLTIPKDGNFAEALLEFKKKDGYETYEVPIRTIDSILDEHQFTNIDFMSIDIEGMELPALQGFSFHRFKPKVVLIEDHFYDLRKHKLMLENLYKLVNRTGCNNWYIPKENEFQCQDQTSSFEFFRKMYLSMPFRKLRMLLKGQKSLY